MSKLIMMCGLPGSTKSTFARELGEKENAIIVSSDSMRKELYGDENNQDNNEELFDKLNERVNLLLSEGSCVIVDATNINRKRRVHLIKHVFKADKKVVYYMNAHVEDCVRNDILRKRRVGKDVIMKMYKTLQIPVKGEGWDEVIYQPVNQNHFNSSDAEELSDIVLGNNSHDKMFSNLDWLVPEFGKVFNLSHDSSYHSFSVSRHIFYVHKYIKDNYEGDDKELMLYAAIFHDVGKGICKTFLNHKGEEKRYSSFIGHDLVSSQITAYYLQAMGYDDSFIKDVVALVQFHMIHSNSEKSLKKIENLIGERLFKLLMVLHEADNSAK